MSSITASEKRQFEKLLNMDGGYVLDFSNRTFQNFVFDVTGKDIYDSVYDYSSGSKANRLRAFWTVESDYIVAKLLGALLEYIDSGNNEDPLWGKCVRIVERLRLSPPIANFDVLEPNANGRDFEILAESIREGILRNEPEAQLDRLHTFVVKYIRGQCIRQGIDASQDKPLHSVFGEYVKSLKARGLIESKMGETILKSNIAILEKFNDVRNNWSLAHDNPLLTQHEALLIFNNVTSIIKFISVVDPVNADATVNDVEDNIPF